MPKLIELMRDETFADLLPKAEESLLIIEERRKADGSAESMRFSFPLNESDVIEITEPIIRAIHAYMWKKGRVAKNLRPPYEKTWKGYIADILRIYEFDKLMTQDQRRLFAGDIARAMRMNDMAVRIGRGKSKDWIVAPPRGGKLRLMGMSVNRKEDWMDSKDWRTEKSIEREAKNERPVVVDFDPSVIPLPDPNPEAVMAYVEKLYAMYEKLRTKYRETAKELSEAHAELEEQREAIKRMTEADEWSIVTQRFAQLQEKVKSEGR